MVEMTRIMEVGYMDIHAQDEEGLGAGRITLSDYQDNNDLDKSIAARFHYHFLKPFGIYNVKEGTTKLAEIRF
jgi:hypothetical protein